MTQKIETKSKIIFIEKKCKDNSTKSSGEITSDDKGVAEIFNKFFVNIVPNLNIPISHNYNADFLKADDPVIKALNKYKYHPSIVMIIKRYFNWNFNGKLSIFCMIFSWK